jgi:hypothetical protein
VKTPDKKAQLTKKEILDGLKKLGLNSTPELNSFYYEYKKYSEKFSRVFFTRRLRMIKPMLLSCYLRYENLHQNKNSQMSINKSHRYMEKRAYKRIPARIKIRYLHWHMGWKNLYTGTIKNLSEEGMFISTNNYFHRDSLIEICIPIKKRVYGIPIKKKYFYIPANLISIAWGKILSNDSCGGIGIELVDPSQEYLDFVRTLIV